MNNIRKGTIMILLLILVVSCNEQINSPTRDISKSEITKPIYAFQKDYNNLNELAKIMAQEQDNFAVEMKEAMLASKIKENIINLKTVISTKLNKKESLSAQKAYEYGKALKEVYEKNSNQRKRTKKLTFDKLLGNTKFAVNSYFPVDSHRENVLKNGKSFWVVVNTPVENNKKEYFVKAYNKNGEIKIFSSKVVPEENVLVLAYTENQELYQQVARPRDGGGSGGGGGTTTYYSGLRVKRVKTHGITDGWLDGDLELRIKISQLAGTIANLSVAGFEFTNSLVYHDAGTWTWFGTTWSESNKWTYINEYRKWSQRQHVTIA